MSIRLTTNNGKFGRTTNLPDETAFTACGFFYLETAPPTGNLTWALGLLGGPSDCAAEINELREIYPVGSGGAGAVVATLTLNTWYFIAITSNGTTNTLYVAAIGAALSSGTAAMGATAVGELAIGYQGNSATQGFLGKWMGVRVWDATLTLAELQLEALTVRAVRRTNINSEFHGIDPAVADGAIDMTGLGRNLTITNSGSYSTSDNAPVSYTRRRFVSVAGSLPIVWIADALPWFDDDLAYFLTAGNPVNASATGVGGARASALGNAFRGSSASGSAAAQGRVLAAALRGSKATGDAAAQGSVLAAALRGSKATGIGAARESAAGGAIRDVRASDQSGALASARAGALRFARASDQSGSLASVLSGAWRGGKGTGVAAGQGSAFPNPWRGARGTGMGGARGAVLGTAVSAGSLVNSAASGMAGSRASALASGIFRGARCSGVGGSRASALQSGVLRGARTIGVGAGHASVRAGAIRDVRAAGQAGSRASAGAGAIRDVRARGAGAGIGRGSAGAIRYARASGLAGSISRAVGTSAVVEFIWRATFLVVEPSVSFQRQDPTVNFSRVDPTVTLTLVEPGVSSAVIP